MCAGLNICAACGLDLACAHPQTQACLWLWMAARVGVVPDASIHLSPHHCSSGLDLTCQRSLLSQWTAVWTSLAILVPLAFRPWHHVLSMMRVWQPLFFAFGTSSWKLLISWRQQNSDRQQIPPNKVHTHGTVERPAIPLILKDTAQRQQSNAATRTNCFVCAYVCCIDDTTSCTMRAFVRLVFSSFVLFVFYSLRLLRCLLHDQPSHFHLLYLQA